MARRRRTPGVRDTIGVAVIDDHPVFRDGTAALLGEAAGITVVGVGGTVDEARAILGSSPPPDVMLLDVRLGGDSGLRLLGEASQRCAVVIFTAYDYPQYMQAALAEGAAGFVAKSATTDELIEAVRRAAAGQLAFRRPVGAAGPALTARDVEVISLVADGLSNDEIGRSLGITSKSVEAHISRIFARTGVRSRTELATTAIRQGWLELPGGAI
jgi:DNA-binding NarL/FixJ family response regulator